MEENKRARNYIIKFLKDLDSNFNAKILFKEYTYFVNIPVNDTIQTIKFPRSLIDDFEGALENHKDSTYFYTLESAIKFNVYIELGSKGFLQGFDVSRAIISEKRDWLTKYRVDVTFDKKMAEILYYGLQYLNRFFTSLLKEHASLEFPEIEEDKKWVKSLIKYYKKEGSLNSEGAEIKNLQYLKAAAVSQIIDLEKKKGSERKQTILKAIDKKIYYIVSQLRKDPFLEIKLPVFISDIKEG